MPLDTNQIKPLALREVQKAAKPIPLTRWYGVYPALVKDLTDPEGMGRVKVLLTWAPDAGGTTGVEKGQQYEGWARLATMMAGPNRGSWFIPDINDEVLVSFQGGHPAFPFVVGALWNGQSEPMSVDEWVKSRRLLSSEETRRRGWEGRPSLGGELTGIQERCWLAVELSWPSRAVPRSCRPERDRSAGLRTRQGQ